MVMLSGVTRQLYAATCTPAAAACRSAAPKAGWVSSLGAKSVTSSIWMTKNAVARCPSYRPHQLVQVPDAPLRGRVGKAGVAAVLQRHALDLHQMQSLPPRQAEVQPGLAEHELRLYRLRRRVEGPRPLREGAVGRLRVHIDEPAALLHRDQVIRRFSVGVGRPLQIYHGLRRQQLPAAPRVLHMAHHRLAALQRRVGDKAVGPRQKPRPHHLSVLHFASRPLLI